MREGDTVARLGGDEFVVILENMASEDDAWMVSQKILKFMTKPLIIEGHDYSSHAVSALRSSPRTRGRQGTASECDGALYLAKNKGRNNASSAPPK